MFFVTDYFWFPSLNIHFTTGVDGIAVAMIMLTSIVVFAGIFASWEMEDLAREFFISLILLATGVFGFFISLDLFTMFLFYELAVIPMYLLIGIWGSGPKEYSAMKLTLMLMGGSALLTGWDYWVFISIPALENGQHTFNLLQIAKLNLPIAVQRFFFPFTFVGFGVLGCSVSVAYMVARWSCLSTYCRFDAACRCADETWRIRLFQGSHVPDAGSSQ